VPSLEFEKTIRDVTGAHHVAGLDEAGRGAIAGPVVAAAVILPLDQSHWRDALRQVDDSKRLSAEKREHLYQLVVQYALAFGVGSVAASDIDRIGIIPATKRAMSLALSQLSPAAECLLIDGRIRLQNSPLPQQSIIRGDSKSLSIAAASILAKVSRDQEMIHLDGQYAQYGFRQHKGYGTPQHLAALAQYGPSPNHRKSFAPLKQRLL
jgi:ribonuclease HII